MAKKKQEVIEDSVLCEGVRLSHTFYDKKENRLLTLLLKGFVVYLLTMGSIGFYLSALRIEYNVLLCHLVIGIMAVLCAMLYYRLLVENLGYLILLVAFGGLVFLFRTYINSGFYAVVNITVDEAAQFFDVDIQRLYNEQIGNRYVTVTFVALFIGIVLDILLNVYISRRMQYVTAIFIVMFLNVIPLYLTDEPDMLYSIMLLAGITMAYAFKSGKHYSPQVSVKRSDRVFEDKSWKRRKQDKGSGSRMKKNEIRQKEISYIYDVKAMAQAGVLVAVLVLASVTVISSFRPKEDFNTGYVVNKYKDLTMAAVSTLLVDGWSGFNRNTYDVGGMDSGRLGNVSTVRLDYQTDMVVDVTPYDYNSIYFKAFTGERYNPYENTWTSIADYGWYDDTVTPEADALKEAYDENMEYTSRGIMLIRYVDKNSVDSALPYYYKDVDSDTSQVRTSVTYYPRLAENDKSVRSSFYGDEGAYTADDLYVPEENRDVIENVVSELALGDGSTEQAVKAVKDYFQDNIPYTVRPGKTPGKKDFVNYFLAENQKGYCAHFASAATLMFRYMGIPARYVEGYAIDYYQITNGELVEDATYGDYYQGYSEIGETALVEVKVTDADAHAWVEIYTPEKGWYVVDVTPTGDTEEVEDFWSVFDDIMGDSDNGADVVEADDNGTFHIPDSLIRNICYAVFAMAAAALVVLMVIRGRAGIIYAIRFHRADTNDRLILLYGKTRKRYIRHHKAYAQKLNYREQVEYVCHEYGQSVQDRGEKQDMEWVSETVREKLISILERAGFSDRKISEEEYEYAERWMKQCMK